MSFKRLLLLITLAVTVIAQEVPESIDLSEDTAKPKIPSVPRSREVFPTEIRPKIIETLVVLDWTALEYIDMENIKVKDVLTDFFHVFNARMSLAGFHIFIKDVIHLPYNEFGYKRVINTTDYMRNLTDLSYKTMYPKHKPDYLLVFTANDLMQRKDTAGMAHVGATCNQGSSMAFMRLNDPLKRGTLNHADALASIACHETGHALGLMHENYNKTDGLGYGSCAAHFANETCMMQQAYYANQPMNQWSNFSLDKLKRTELGLLTTEEKTWFQGSFICLFNQPNQEVIYSTNYPICGNGIVEVAEECDCFFSDKDCRLECIMCSNGSGRRAFIKIAVILLTTICVLFVVGAYIYRRMMYD